MGDPATRGMAVGVETVLHTRVATLYSNLVTRPTGRAVRVAIEQQIQDSGGPCLAILDFSHVGVIDFSCADEVIAKLLRTYRRPDRPCEAFFLAHGVSEHHRDLIEAVLQRHNQLLVAVESGRPALWGPAPARLHTAWDCLNRLGCAFSAEFASARGVSPHAASSWLKRLANWRVAVREAGGRFASLWAILERRPGYGGEVMEMSPYGIAAERIAPYGPKDEASDRVAAGAEDVTTFPHESEEIDQLPAW
jgi:hypothetical protein